jgi:hypothetical protein
MDEPMTVKQLMEELKQMDKWAEVHIERYDKIGSTRYELHTFEIFPLFNEFILYFR